MNEIKLSNIVLDLKKVESSESIDDLIDYKFENKDYINRIKSKKEELDKVDDMFIKTDDWLSFQNIMILRLERDILEYVKALY